MVPGGKQTPLTANNSPSSIGTKRLPLTVGTTILPTNTPMTVGKCPNKPNLIAPTQSTQNG